MLLPDTVVPQPKAAAVPASALCVRSQNCLEFYPVFLVTLWTSGMFFSEALAAAAGLLYVVARQMYFNGYIQSTKKRSSTLLDRSMLKGEDSDK